MAMTTDGEWTKSSYSSSNDSCVQWRIAGPEVELRDSEDPDGPVLTFGPAAWQAFTAAVRAGECDPS